MCDLADELIHVLETERERLLHCLVAIRSNSYQKSQKKNRN
jgi:hypothetical protein